MALAVDTTGKVVASPNTGKVMGSSGSNGAGAAKPSSGNTLADALANVIAEVKEATSQGVTTAANELQSPTRRKTYTQQDTYVQPMTASMPTSLGTTTQQSRQQEGQPKPTLPANLGSMLASGATPKVEDDEPRRESGLDWEIQRSTDEGRDARDVNYFGEPYAQNDDGHFYPWYVGNSQTNDEYLRNAIANGLTDDEAYAFTHRMSTGALNDISKDMEMLDEMDLSKDLFENRTSAIDDGTSYDYAHMTSEWMTGPQYKRYVEMGMGGRPVDKIDPTQVYSKMDEANEYGFIPFVPDKTTYNTMYSGDVLRVPGELGSMVANARTSLAPDYWITYGQDDKTTINGNDFERLAPAMLNNYYYNLQQDPEYYWADHGGNSNPSVLQYAIPTADGKTAYAHGSIVDSGFDDTLHLTFSDGQQIDVSQDELETWPLDQEGLRVIPDEYFEDHGDLIDSGYDDTLYLTFSDGQTIGLSPDYVAENIDQDGMIDLANLASMVPVDEAEGALPEDLSSLGENSVYYAPMLVMPDGTEIPVDDVERLYWDKTADDDESIDDDDISYDFNGGISKPRRLMSQEPITIDEDGVRLNAGAGELLTDAVDWSLGSLPISAGKFLPWIYSVSQAPTALYGVNSGSYNPETGSYGLIAGGWDDEGNLRYGVQDASGDIDQKASDTTRMWNALGTAAIPLTEQLVGPVGSHIIPLEGLTSKIPFRSYLGKHIADTLVGGAAEGIEEDLGNIFDELMQYGPSGAFANPVMRDGEVIRDMYGHEVRDPESTAALQRASRFFDPTELANSFLGGAAVSGLLGSPQFLGGLQPSIMADRARLTSGVNKYVETDLERDVREALENGEIPDVPSSRKVSDRYVSQFNDYRGDR